MPIVDVSHLKDMPPGTYDARFLKFENKNSENISLEFDVTEPEYEGKKQWQNLNLKTQSLWKLKESCLALGVDPEDFVGSIDTDAILSGVLGNDCRIVLEAQGEDAGQYAGRVSVARVLAPAYVTA